MPPENGITKGEERRMIPSLRIIFLNLGLLLTACAFASQSLAQSLTGSNSSTSPESNSSNPENDVNTGTNNPGGTNPGSPQQQAISTQFNNRYLSRDRNAPRRDNIEAFRIVKHINALFSGFEQGAGVGLGVELTTADKVPGVEFRGKFLISTRFYRRLEAEAYIPSVGDKQNHADIWFTYIHRLRDNFFGIGPTSPEEPKTNYASEYRMYNAALYRDFTPQIQLGIFASLINSDAYNGEDESEIPINVLFSGQPTVIPITRWLPGLNNNAKLIGYGAFIEYNGRDNERGLTKGAYLYSRFGSYDGLKDASFSDFGWNEVVLDGRAYVPMFSDFTSVALRTYTELLDTKGGSQIPFYLLPWIGGRSHLRGFDNYRFRANNLLLFSIEPRRTVWRQSETKGVDAFLFGDAGQVWGDSRSTTNPQVLANNQMNSSFWRYGIGGGAQYRMGKNFGVRIDIGHSSEGTRAYFSFSRGF
jgi:surface antigen Omp85-like protein